jgi:uncharacterized iron-regulated membrane protein
MGRPRFSIRALIVVVAVAGFDAATMARALHQGRLAHLVREYAMGFGLVLLVLNLDILALLAYYARAPRSASGSRLNSTPPPLVIAGTYLAVLAIAILSVLFLTSGLF